MSNINKNLFIQNLKEKYTLLQQVTLLIDTVIQLIDNENIINIDKLKEYTDNIVINKDTNTVEVGPNLYVDGNIKTDSDILNSSLKIKPSYSNTMVYGTLLSLLEDDGEYVFIRITKASSSLGAGLYIIRRAVNNIYGIMLSYFDNTIRKVAMIPSDSDFGSTISTLFTSYMDDWFKLIL